MITVDLFDILQHTWQTICADYDVTADLPDIGALFEGVDPSAPAQAAQGVLVNLLSDVMECVGRFSPWYKKPASAFGIVYERGDSASASRWGLTAKAIQARQPLLNALAAAIARNKSVILATHFFQQQAEQEKPCCVATCQCVPPRAILIHQSVIAHIEIICDTCRQPFT